MYGRFINQNDDCSVLQRRVRWMRQHPRMQQRSVLRMSNPRGTSGHDYFSSTVRVGGGAAKSMKLEYASTYFSILHLKNTTNTSHKKLFVSHILCIDLCFWLHG